MKGRIFFSERVNNKGRTFGADTTYIPAIVVGRDGSEMQALFSVNQITVALERAARNPEDLPKQNVLDRIRNFLLGR
jgi:hypothetical protein